jgi:lipopolysaccharide export LptBFGC system permease protein LptF
MILKRLVFTSWLKAFFGAFFLLLLVLVLASFVDASIRETVTVEQSLVNFLYEFPSWLKKIFPFACLCGTLFGLESLKRHNELVAIFASGYPALRVFYDVLILGCFLGSFLIVNNSIISPMANKARLEWLQSSGARFKKASTSETLKGSVSYNGRFWLKGKGFIVAYKAFEKKNGIIKDAQIFHLSKDGSRLREYIESNNLIPMENSDSWLFDTYYHLKELDIKNFPILEEGQSLSSKQPIDIDMFDWGESEVFQMGPLQLYDYWTYARQTGTNLDAIQIHIFEIINNALTTLIFTLIPISVLFNPNRRAGGLGKNLFFTIVFTVIYWLVYSSMMGLATSGRLNAGLAIFGPSLVALSYVAYRAFKLRKL